jgi:hypothetical protein
MRFPIDVVFVNRKKRVVKIHPNLMRGRIAFSLRAHSVLELPAGRLVETGTQRGDQLEFKTLKKNDGLEVDAVSGAPPQGFTRLA